MGRSQPGEGLGQIMSTGVRGQMNDADGPRMMDPQRFPQQPPELRQASACGKEQQRTGVPGWIVVERTAVQLAQAEPVPWHQTTSPVTEQSGIAAIQVEFEKVIEPRQARQGIGPGDAL